MMSICMISPQEWITTIIIIVVTTHPTKTVIITNHMAQPIRMSPVPTQPTKMVPDILPQPIPTILQIITNKRQWITMF